ncbi:MAG: spore coat protein [Clostridia bacterium]|nr:spore coat protein [Clostridia bacterium]
MTLSQKETMLLGELRSQEQVCIEKYGDYSNRAKDAQLKNIFGMLMQKEQEHMNTIDQMLSGTVPQMNGSCGSNMPQPKASDYSGEDKNADKYLCMDALANEKHVSSVYDMSIFEFRDEGMRNALNHIQKEEQEHGKQIYDFMAANGMYSA